MARVRRALGVLLAIEGAAGADEVHWLTEVAIRNDVFADLTPPIDDAGFTHDNLVSVRREHGELRFGGSFLHRWITSRVDRRRWDQVEVLALAERTWLPRLTTSARLGPSLGGNFGGRKMQNGWHALSGTGPTLEEGLQSDYPGDRRIGITAGVGARIELGDAFGGYGVADGQVAIGTGLAAFEIAAGARASSRHVVAYVEIALQRYHPVDPNLGLPGGYGTGFQVAWRVGVDVRWSRFQLGYEYRANEGGSGEPVGVIAFQSRR